MKTKFCIFLSNKEKIKLTPASKICSTYKPLKFIAVKICCMNICMQRLYNIQTYIYIC